MSPRLLRQYLCSFCVFLLLLAALFANEFAVNCELRVAGCTGGLPSVPTFGACQGSHVTDLGVL